MDRIIYRGGRDWLKKSLDGDVEATCEFIRTGKRRNSTNSGKYSFSEALWILNQVIGKNRWRILKNYILNFRLKLPNLRCCQLFILILCTWRIFFQFIELQWNFDCREGRRRKSKLFCFFSKACLSCIKQIPMSAAVTRTLWQLMTHDTSAVY